MKIFIAGKERSELAEQIRQTALKLTQSPRQPDEVSEAIGAPALAKALSDDDYLDNFIRLLRYRDAVDTLDFDIPRRPGAVGWIMTKLKKKLWRLLRYQHDRITFRQNLINSLFTGALEWERQAHRREITELRERIAKLEKNI